jgi:hypothetical protein
LTTAQNIIDQARSTVNDDDKTRYKDIQALGFINFRLRQLRRDRPDLFIGNLASPINDLVLTDSVPTPASVDQALSDYVLFRWSTMDNEDNTGSSRADSLDKLQARQI